MFIETLTAQDEVVGNACEGKLTEDGLKRMYALLLERLEAVEQPGLVVDLTGLEGYEGLIALREDLKMDIAHRNDFSRIAVIGDAKWKERGTTLAGALTRAEMRWFEASKADEVAEWARHG